MYLRVIACEVLAREVYLAAATSPHMIDVELVDKGLHETPELLRAELQRRIDAVDDNTYDRVVLAYGLCGNSTQGLVARHKPLVLVRAHDCITIYLGSRARYGAEFMEHPGTYYYSDDYVERSERTGSLSVLGAAAGTGNDVQKTYDEYVLKYGEDNAKFLMETMGAWKDHYKRAAYISMGILPGCACRERALDEASRRGWEFVELQGDGTLVNRLIAGEWDDDFMIVQPGQRVASTYAADIVAAVDDPDKG
jgi:hypothetical protein